VTFKNMSDFAMGAYSQSGLKRANGVSKNRNPSRFDQLRRD
jgi:hypothetical protein